MAIPRFRPTSIFTGRRDAAQFISWQKWAVTNHLEHLAEWLPLFTIVLGVIYSGFLVHLYLGPSRVPDEWWFLNVAHELQPSKSLRAWAGAILQQDNHLGYGAIYWLLYRLCIVISRSPFMLMRGISLALFLSIPLSFIYGCSRAGVREKYLGFLLAVLWLTFPAAWWTGKVTAPEPASMALTAFALARIRIKGEGSIGAWICLGLACGLKVTCIPSAVYGFLVCLHLNRRSFFRSIRNSTVFLVSFVGANPFLLTSQRHVFLDTLQKFGRSQTLDAALHSVPLIFTKRAWEWDVLPSNGFFLWGLQGASTVAFILLLALGFLSKKTAMALVFSLMLNTAMLAINYNFLGWYWFPTLILMVAGLMWGELRNNLQLGTLLSVIVLNCFLQAPTIQFNYQMKKQHDKLLTERDRVQRDLQPLLEMSQAVDFVFDLSDLGLDLDFGSLQKKNKKTFVYIEPKWGSHYASGMTVPPQLCGRGLVLSGPRFLKHPAIGKTESWIQRVYPSFKIISTNRAMEGFEVLLVQSECTT